MSIILEALKKVTKENPVEPAAEAAIRELNTPRLARPKLVPAIIILAGGFLLFFLLKGKDIPIAKEAERKAQPTNIVLPAKSVPAAEGYAPINIFKIKIPSAKLTLNGIVSGMGAPTAIIDNELVEEGSSISDAKVVKIYNDKVELRNEASGELFILTVH